MKPGILKYWLAFWTFSRLEVFKCIYFNKSILDNQVVLLLYPATNLLSHLLFSFSSEGRNLPVTTHEFDTRLEGSCLRIGRG